MGKTKQDGAGISTEQLYDIRDRLIEEGSSSFVELHKWQVDNLLKEIGRAHV